jgi:uncharacterized protein YkwD
MQTSRRSLKDTSRNLIQVLVAFICALVMAGCAPSAASSELYTVQSGDTLAKIAAANDTTVEKLVELNVEAYPSLESNPGAIEVGWKLKVPANKSGISVTSKKGPAAANSSDSTSTLLDQDAFEAEITRLINEERSKAGLITLQVDSSLVQFARERSSDMVARGYFGHADPETGEDLYVSMLRSHGVRGLIAENTTQLLRTTSTSESNAVRATSNWITSDGHRMNILDPAFHKTGVGITVGSDYIIVTQLFAE